MNLLLILFTMWVGVEHNDPTILHSDIAKNGQGVYSFLRTYNLDEQYCNHSKFYDINDMDQGDPLIVDKHYKLPIYIYDFDGRSIRSSIDSNDWDLAIQIKEYNEFLVAQDFVKLMYQESKKLYIPHHLLHCNIDPSKKLVSVSTSAEAPKTKTAIYALLGEKRKRVTIGNQDLAGQVYFISAGHGGPDPGTIGKRNGRSLCEDEYAYDVCLRLSEKLLENGAKVYMLNEDKNDGIREEEYLKCDHDEKLYGNRTMSRRQLRRLQQRTDITNKLYKENKSTATKQRFVAIHVDSRAAKQQADVFFYHAMGSIKGEKLAQNIQGTFKEKYDHYQKGRGYKGTVYGRDLYVLKNTRPVSVYIELGNINNRSNQLRIIQPDNRQFLAEWIYEGLVTSKK